MQEELANEEARLHTFLQEMYDDQYFPDALVDKGKAILVELCANIERERPESDPEVYALTHAATEAFNELAEEFDEQDSEIETVAREAIGADVGAILRMYGFGHLDVEEAIAPRDW